MPDDTQYYRDLAARHLAGYDAEAARRYRQSDDEGLGSPTHADYGDLLAEVSASFGRPITVLDLGCGTGRYWHHLVNVRHLTGVDVVPEMLMQAQHPVRAEAILFPRTLVCANIPEVELPAASFDLVYAIGVLGRLLPLDGYLVNVVARVLTPGGIVVVTASDRQTYAVTSWKRRLIAVVLPLLPGALQRAIRVHLLDFSLTEAQCWALFQPPVWRSVTVTNRRGATKTEWVVRATKGEVAP